LSLVESYRKKLSIKMANEAVLIGTLSGGNQQKVLLARCMALQPKVLIVDEPTRGIDVGAKAEIQKLVRELADRGLGLLMVSSEVEEIVEGSDRAYVLRDGRTVGSFAGEGLTGDAIMDAMAHGTTPEHRPPPAGASTDD
jgi:monosaccharide-transporting ATPase